MHVHAQEETEGEHEEGDPEEGVAPLREAELGEQHAVHVLQAVMHAVVVLCTAGVEASAAVEVFFF